MFQSMASKSMSESKSLCSSSIGGSGQLSTSLSSSRCCMPASSIQCSDARLCNPSEKQLACMLLTKAWLI